MRIRFLVPFLTAAGVAAPLALAAPAVASSDHPLALGAHSAFGAAARHSASLTNTGVAGYESAALALTTMTLTTTTVVPHIKRCGSTNTDVIPFVGGDNGGKSLDVGISVGCKNGKARYFPIFAIDGTVKSYPGAAASPGDKLVLRLNGSKTSASLSLKDKTHPGVSKTLTGAVSSSYEDAIVGDSRGPSGSPIPNFGTASFSKSILNGAALGLAPSLEQFNMVNSSSVLEIETGPLGSDEESFTTTFKHS